MSQNIEEEDIDIIEKRIELLKLEIIKTQEKLDKIIIK